MFHISFRDPFGLSVMRNRTVSPCDCTPRALNWGTKPELVDVPIDMFGRARGLFLRLWMFGNLLVSNREGWNGFWGGTDEVVCQLGPFMPLSGRSDGSGSASEWLMDGLRFRHAAPVWIFFAWSHREFQIDIVRPTYPVSVISTDPASSMIIPNNRDSDVHWWHISI
jgi:hypothetical protein